MPENYWENGFQTFPSIALDSTLRKLMTVRGNGSYKWVNNANDPDILTEDLVWGTDGSITIRNLSGGFAAFNVKTFGAQGNGVANDSADIQEAIDAASAAGGGIVFFPPGTYLLGSAITQRSNVWLLGVGWASILKVNNTGTAGFGSGIITVGAGVGTTSNIGIWNLQIDGNKAALAIADAGNEKRQSNIDWDKVNHGFLINVYSHSAVMNGAYINNSPVNIDMRGCRMDSNGKVGTTSGGRGLTVNTSPQQVRIIGNHLSSNLESGITLMSEGGSNCQDIVISNNNVLLNGNRGIDIGDNAFAGVGVDILCRRISVTSNTISGNTGAGIRLHSEGTQSGGFTSRTQNVIVSGNTISGNTTNGVQLSRSNDGDVRRCIIIGNNITDNTSAGISVGASVADTVLDGNAIFDNGSTISDSGTRTVFGVNKIDTTTSQNLPNGLNTSVADNTGQYRGNGVVLINEGGGKVQLDRNSAGILVGDRSVTGIGAGDIGFGNNTNIRFFNNAGTTHLEAMRLDTGDVLRLGFGASDLQWGKALVALGGGAAPTFGTIGGSGPATAAQNSWMRVVDTTGAAFWVPVWK